jgi:hypothetical protein
MQLGRLGRCTTEEGAPSTHCNGNGTSQSAWITGSVVGSTSVLLCATQFHSSTLIQPSRNWAVLTKASFTATRASPVTSPSRYQPQHVRCLLPIPVAERGKTNTDFRFLKVGSRVGIPTVERMSVHNFCALLWIQKTVRILYQPPPPNHQKSCLKRI